MKYDTETIDRLFLELSQFTTAFTKRELRLAGENAKLLCLLDDWMKMFGLHGTRVPCDVEFEKVHEATRLALVQ